MKTKFYPLKRIMTWVISGVLSCLPVALFAQFPVCSNPNTLFGLDYYGGIYPIAPATAVSGALINTADYTLSASYTTVVASQTSSANMPNGLGYNNTDGKFYYFKRDPGGGSGQFICYNPVINKYTTLAPLPGTNSVHAGCVNFNGTGYYCLDTQSYLYYFNIATGVWTTISNNFKDQFGANVTSVITSENSGDMAVDGKSNLWLLPSNSSNYTLYKLSAPLPTAPVAGSISVWRAIPTTATPLGDAFYGMAFDPMGNIFMSTAANDLYKITATTTTSPVLVANITTSGSVMLDLSSCAFPLTVLPVQFSAFTATLKNNGAVLLSWIVPPQDENRGFDIEHSADGINWEVIGLVGNSHTNQDGTNGDAYFYTDPKPGSHVTYYRIHAINYDGTGFYSPVRVIIKREAANISVWPNPVSDVVNIQINSATNGSGNAYALVFDMSGNVLLRNALQPGANAINLKNLPSSMYEIQVHMPGGETYNQKIIRQ